MSISAPPKTVDRSRLALAQQMLVALFVLTKTARVYEANNDSYRSQAARFYTLLQKCLEDRNSCTVKVVSRRLFVDEQFVSIDSDDRIGVRSVLERWTELGIGGLVFGDTIKEKDIDILVHLLWSFSTSGGDPFVKITDELSEHGVDSVYLMPKNLTDKEHQIGKEERQRIRLQARNTFFRAIATVKDVMTTASKREKISVSRTRRVVHSIIDLISRDDAALLELTSIKDFDEYTYAHSTNVCIYSLTLGTRLGMNRKELSELGFAAMFHDVGKIKLPNDLITKPDRYDEFDWAQMHKHPTLGAMTLASMLQLDTHMARATTVAFEHHINPDHTGYPTLPEKRSTNLYSRIVSVADSFDALTSSRVYIKDSISADEVLRKMMYQMTAKFDAFLLKQFVNIIGIYPIGCLVLLSNNTLAVVTRTNSSELNRPELRIIADSDGRLENPEWIDLAEVANRSIDILRIIDPKKYDIDLTDIILSE